MMTSSEAPGIEAPPHVAEMFQFPLAEAVLVAACTVDTGKAASMSITIMSAKGILEINGFCI
jgi:hypothetical protein